jgi:hypothetical protein
MKLDKIFTFISTLWKEFDTVLELFIYLGIAFAIQKLFGLTYIQALLVILVYFLVNMLRVIVERMRQ